MATVFVLLGMSRSGTSAIARGLQAIGVDFGDNLLPGDKRNPKGFWEDAEILYNVNRGISRVINYAWLTAKEAEELELKNKTVIDDYKQYAVKILQARLANAPSWGFKDPRTTVLLPFWHAVFRAANVEERYVIAMRNPLSTAQSNQKFSEFDPEFGIERGLICWLNQMVACIDRTQGKKRIIVNFEAILENPQLQLQRMHKALGVNSELDEREVEIYAKEFLDKKLNHHSFSEQELRGHPMVAVAPLCIDVHQLLLRVANDTLAFESEEFATAWAVIKAKYDAIFPIYQFLERKIVRNKDQQREIRDINRSLLWKITYPWQMIRRSFKQYRRNLKERQRLVKSNG